MIWLAERTFWEEFHEIGVVGQSPKVRGGSVLKWLEALWKQGSNGMRSGGVESDATVVGRGPVAFPGRMGQCASAHNHQAMECPRKVLALWRALLLPSGEGANGPQGAESAWAQQSAA